MRKNFEIHNLILAGEDPATMHRFWGLNNLIDKAKKEIQDWESTPPNLGVWADDFTAFVRQVYGDLFEYEDRIYGYWRVKSVEIKITAHGPDRKIHYSEVRDNGALIKSVGSDMARVRHLEWLVKRYLVPYVSMENHRQAYALSTLTANWFSGGSSTIKVSLKPFKIIYS